MHSLLLSKRPSRLGFDVVVEISMLAVLHHEVVVLRGLNALVEPDDVVVLHFG